MHRQIFKKKFFFDLTHVGNWLLVRRADGRRLIQDLITKLFDLSEFGRFVLAPRFQLGEQLILLLR